MQFTFNEFIAKDGEELKAMRATGFHVIGDDTLARVRTVTLRSQPPEIVATTKKGESSDPQANFMSKFVRKNTDSSPKAKTTTATVEDGDAGPVVKKPKQAASRVKSNFVFDALGPLLTDDNLALAKVAYHDKVKSATMKEVDGVKVTVFKLRPTVKATYVRTLGGGDRPGRVILCIVTDTGPRTFATVRMQAGGKLSICSSIPEELYDKCIPGSLGDYQDTPDPDLKHYCVKSLEVPDIVPKHLLRYRNFEELNKLLGNKLNVAKKSAKPKPPAAEADVKKPVEVKKTEEVKKTTVAKNPVEAKKPAQPKKPVEKRKTPSLLPKAKREKTEFPEDGGKVARPDFFEKKKGKSNKVDDLEDMDDDDDDEEDDEDETSSILDFVVEDDEEEEEEEEAEDEEDEDEEDEEEEEEEEATEDMEEE